MRDIMLVVCFVSIASCASTNTIIDKPIEFGVARQQLSLQYMSQRYGVEQRSPVMMPRMIVLHWTAIPTFEVSFETFDPPYISGSRTDIQSAGALNVSAHFLVDRDGTIYRLMPEISMARHVIGLNHCAIGVENVGGTPDMPLTRGQRRANIWLVKYLKAKYPIRYLIGHYEYTNFEGHELWLEKDDSYRTIKTDPGIDFMRKVRKATKKFNFKPIPQKTPFNEY